MVGENTAVMRRVVGPTDKERLRELGAVLGDVMAAGADRVEEMHLGIAGRVFRAVGPLAAPARVAHDVLSRRAYRALRVTLRAAGRATGAAAARLPIDEGARIDWRELRIAAGAVSGMYGDRLAERHPALAVPMTVRSGGDDVALERDTLAAVYPKGGRRLAVFLHGLCETEESWGRPAQDEDTPGTYGDRLRRHLGLVPIFVRYNTGLHISDNGRRLAALIDTLVREWPDQVEELALVGHSMGGLVVRSACDVALRTELSWVRLVRHCVYLGTPHDGAPLERGTNLLAGTLRRLPETRALASLLDIRSAGIKDLRFGYVRDEDWFGHDPDAVLVDTGSDLPLLETARHHCVAATLGDTPHHVLSRLLGDLLVLHPSASGHGRRGTPLPLHDDDRRHIGGITHFHLLDHPGVADLLRDWLTTQGGAAGAPRLVDTAAAAG